MLFTSIGLLLTLYLPGAALFRAPVLDRARRATLSAEERAYWAIVLSVAWSSIVAGGLAAFGVYTIGRLLSINAVLVAVLVAVLRGRLRLAGATRPGLSAATPLLLVVLGAWLFFPPSEYIIGGKDPGVYINEGVQIAQRRAVITHDPVVRSVPPPFRDLFYPSHHVPSYYSVRFMGFFILDPDQGTVVGQFPHLYPVWIAIGYGLNGLSGARQAVGACALLGVLGLYFLGARLVGRTTAGVAAALLAISVVQVWFARYPNAEMLTQALVLAGLLAFERSHVDEDPFFEPVAGVVLGLVLFARIDAALAVIAVAATALLLRAVGVRLKPAFIAPLITLGLLAFVYYVVVLSPYAAAPLYVLTHPTWLQIGIFGGGAVAVLIAYVLAGVPAIAGAVRVWLPRVIAIAMAAAAVYAYVFRAPGGRLAWHDANSLRMFGWYVHPAGIAAGIIGLVLVAWRRFWHGPAVVLAACVYALFVFYKIQIVPEHFWMARRFVIMIVPAVLLFAATAILAGIKTQLLAPPGSAGLLAKGDRFTRIVIRLVLLALLASSLFSATRPILPHVEYAGIIPRLEQLSNRFSDRDLLIVESRNASDLHVLALPLAYIYARDVLVLATPKPDKATFGAFLDWAHARYSNVYFLGGGGTDLLSRRIGVAPVSSERFQVPEYESLLNAYPTHVRFKEFDFGIYRFGEPAPATGRFTLDVGTRDDLNVVRFNAKEQNASRSFRWTRDVSYVSILGVSPATSTVTMVMENGGRPAIAGPARVDVFLNDVPLGSAVVGSKAAPYSFHVPPEVARAASATDEAALLKIVSSTWNPRASTGANDDRTLGVMLDRVEVQ